MTPKISAVVITKNEESNILQCLDSIRWADEVIVVDAGSLDRTVEYVKRYTSKVHTVPFLNFQDQKNKAISYATGEWILIIDADERVSEALALKIQEIVRTRPLDSVYALKRITFHFGRRFRFSGTQSDYPVRLFPRGKGTYIQPVHEKLVTDLPVIRIEQPLMHPSSPDLKRYFEKFHHYLRLENEWLLTHKRVVHWWDVIFRPIWRFGYLYLWQGGFLDLYPGLQYCVLSAYYDYLKYKNYYFRKKS
jgi:glycosyltransferase involved in cell wall biosynthesis